eukprot:8706833-Pyramimonas_sp.AAC.1
MPVASIGSVVSAVSAQLATWHCSKLLREFTEVRREQARWLSRGLPKLAPGRCSAARRWSAPTATESPL